MHFQIPADTVMTPEVLAKYIGKHKDAVALRLGKLGAAYRNDYQIYHDSKKPAGKPDNRVSVNFAKYIVDTFNGFFCGIPIRATSDDEKVNSYLEQLDAYNDQDANNSELSKLCSIFGSAHEMYFIDEYSNECITYLSPMQSFFLVDDSILHRPLFFIHYYLDADNIERGSWSDASVVQHFENRGSYKWTDEPKYHYFGGVPAMEYRENREQIGIFESALPLIDAYNRVLSDKTNDVDYFSDAYMKIIGKELTPGQVAMIRDSRVVNLWDDQGEDNTLDVGFMERPSGDGTQENLLTRIERLIFQTCQVPNISDENFGTSSGIALRYKLLGTSNLAKTKERMFRSGMNGRYKLLFSNPVITGTGVTADDWMKVSVQFSMNYPANIADEATTARNLEGIVSKETQLSVLSIVDNPKKEIERMEDEEQSQMNSRLETVTGMRNERQ